MNILDIASSALMAAKLLPGFALSSDKNVTARPDQSAWREEQEDILERANWLYEKILVDPNTLIKTMPSLLSEEYKGQWAIYCCSMLAHAFANICFIYPERADKCAQLISRLVDMVYSPAMRRYDIIEWKEDPIESLVGDRHHMTYLSILSWMITNYKMSGGDDRYDNLLHNLCEALNRRMLKSPFNLNLLSFPRKPIFLPDMLVALIALKNYGRIFDGRYASTEEAWLHNARTKWIHRPTGLLAGMLPGASRKKSMSLKGSYAALNCSYLSLVDEDFALEQYEKMKQIMRREVSFMGKNICGIKEYLRKDPAFRLAAGDAGLVIEGISAGGTAFAIGAATYFGDWEFRYQLLRTAEIAGGSVCKDRKRHYRLSEMFLVGEATALAMRTNIKRY